MSDTSRWVIAIVLALLVVGLIAFARGPDHHRGDETGEGSIGSAVLVVGT